MTTDEAKLMERPSIVLIGDRVEGGHPHGLVSEASVELENEKNQRATEPFVPTACEGADRATLDVVGGYLERLPLACVKFGLVDHAEIWHHSRSFDAVPASNDSPWLTRRVFRLDREEPPFPSRDMLRFIEAVGAPNILIVLGLGVDERILRACGRSLKVYNSIDAPALRVPPEVSRHFDLVLTGAEWQSEEVRGRHPAMRCAVMPIGPEFADPETFRPLGREKTYDVVYVAAAQGYKRHDILFDALAAASRPLRALCVFGYGEMADALRAEAQERSLDIDFVGPPGVGFAKVNALMNQACVGVVCGVDDGAPAILTEYMLAGLPVLANERLVCGLQFVTPKTGRTAPAEGFAEALVAMLDDPGAFQPRQTVLERWIWPRTVKRFAGLVEEIRASANPCCGAERTPARRVEN